MKSHIEKENIKIFDIRIGSVNKELMNLYCEKYNIRSHLAAIKQIIEETLLEKPIKSKEDVDNAIYYSENMLYNSLGEIVEAIARQRIQKRINVCSNCRHFKNKTCSLNNTRVDKYDQGCERVEWIEE